ncbi:hypothetical protein [Frigoribacterium sp. VKM Ac-2836]|uniref:hypothetical protein n=1 Tax=Frigoribacterium sp. VKM Ac-2836 TaxID=2739014 RepID=UPI0015660D45|nr:hypothetical protein [Frigoribacterium sp. VKM Ac-2836]NRD27752.1 hypothetical protein [Frigoribacterium sp. VKM Ac-2836]
MRPYGVELEATGASYTPVWKLDDNHSLVAEASDDNAQVRDALTDEIYEEQHDSAPRSVCVAAALVLVSIGLSGCNSETRDSARRMLHVDEKTDRVDLPALRRDIMAVQRRFASMGPEDQIVSILEPPDGVLMSCSGGQFQWTGSTSVEYSTVPDEQGYFERLEEELVDDVGFTTKRQFSPDGESERLIVTSEDGTRYSVKVWTGISKVQVTSSSWCFTVQPGQTNGGEF